MIGALEIGKPYHIKGTNLWKDVEIDIFVASITSFREGEKMLESEIKKTWFDPYKVPDKVFEYLAENNVILYGVKVIESRDPILFSKETEEAKLQYIFNHMINFEESDNLVMGQKYKYTVFGGIYSNDAVTRPETLNVDIPRVLNEAITPHLADSLVVQEDPLDILVEESKYKKIDNARHTKRLKYEQELNSTLGITRKNQMLLTEGLLNIDEKINIANAQLENSRKLYIASQNAYSRVRYAAYTQNEAKAKLILGYNVLHDFYVTESRPFPEGFPQTVDEFVESLN